MANSHLRDLVSYEPGKPIEDLARELGIAPQDIIKLASNENPLGPSPKAIAAMQESLTRANFYPDGGGYYLRGAIAAKNGLARENIILGSGSNEIIEFIGHAFLRPGDEIITSRHAFAVYHLMAQLFGATTVEVAEKPGFVQDLDAMLAAITPRTRQVYITSPNNPTGTIVTADEIERFMERVPSDVDRGVRRGVPRVPRRRAGYAALRARGSQRASSCARSRRSRVWPTCASATAWRACH